MRPAFTSILMLLVAMAASGCATPTRQADVGGPLVTKSPVGGLPATDRATAGPAAARTSIKTTKKATRPPEIPPARSVPAQPAQRVPMP
jgi:hypothetical protein